MATNGNTRYGSATGATILIGFGVFFLILNLWPNLHPWVFLGRFWPVLLIILGVGKLWDYHANSQHSETAGRSGFLGTLTLVLVALVLTALLAHWGRYRNGSRWGDDGADLHESQSVDLEGAQSVTADIDMPSGSLEMGGGANQLLDADFSYSNSRQKPRVDYSVAGGHGQLRVTARNDHTIFGNNRNNSEWSLHFANTTPLDLNLNMGAGQSDMKLGDLNVTNLKVDIGAGQMNLDLTGDRKNNLQAQIEGGVGAARIRLPKNSGVRVHASGGIGSIDAEGLKRDGDYYINDAYGNAPTTITMTIDGGVGEIKLEEEP